VDLWNTGTPEGHTETDRKKPSAELTEGTLLLDRRERDGKLSVSGLKDTSLGFAMASLRETIAKVGMTKPSLLELLEELATGAGDVDAAGNAAFAVFGALHDASRLAALRAVRRLGRVHLFFAISCFCDLCHVDCPWVRESAKNGAEIEDDCGISQLSKFT
jgi:hypothetical protein